MGTELIQMYNSYAPLPGEPSMLRKALDSSAGAGGALAPEFLEEAITNAVVRLSPEIAIIGEGARFGASQKTHEFVRLAQLPGAGGAMGENAVTPRRASKYDRATVDLKIVRRKGGVTNFLKSVSSAFIDAAAAEWESNLQSHIYDIITYVLYGNKTADQFTFDGIDTFLATNRINGSQGGDVLAALTTLNNMIDKNTRKNGQRHKKVFLMSPEMLSRVSDLLTNVRLNQGLIGNGITQVNIGGGWRLNAYRDIPIIESDAMRPVAKMTTVGIASSGAGSGIPAGTYIFEVAPITWQGEQAVSTAVPITITNEDQIDLSWTAFVGPQNAKALGYKIYATDGAADTQTLVRVISGITYDGNGTPTGDATGTIFLNVNPSTPDASVPTHMQNDVSLRGDPAVAAPMENILLWDLDPVQGMGRLPYTNEDGSRFGGLVTMEPLAKTDDFLEFLVKSYLALADPFEATSVLHRGLKVA